MSSPGVSAQSVANDMNAGPDIRTLTQSAARLQSIQKKENADPETVALQKGVDQSLQTEKADTEKLEIREAQAEQEGVDLSKDTWNADKEMANYATDPIKAFGSAGSVFAILASAFTHRPFVAAMNGAAAAMNAIHKGDQDAYEKAYDSWKTNNELALKRHQLEMDDIKGAIEMLGVEPARAQAELAAHYAKYDYQKAQVLQQAGLIKDQMDLHLKSEEVGARLAEIQPELQKFNIQYRGYQQDAATAKTPREKAEAYQRWFGPGRMTLANVQAQAVDDIISAGGNPIDALKTVLTGSHPMTDAQREGNEMKLEKQFTTEQPVKDFRETSTAKQLSEKLLADPTHTGQEDYATMFAYLRGLNPKAVVRMSEVTAAEGAASWADTVNRWAGRIASGRMLSESQIKNMVSVIDQTYDIRKRQYEAVRSHYEKQAETYGLDPANVLGDDEAAGDKSGETDFSHLWGGKP